MCAEAKAAELATLGGIRITDPVDLELDYEGRAEFVTTLNSELILLAREMPRLANIMNSGRVTIDGTWTLWAYRRQLRSSREARKLSGSDLIYEVTKKAVEKGRRVMLLGGDTKANAAAVDRLRTLTAGNDYVTGFSPEFADYPFPGRIQNDIKEQLRIHKPDILILGFGIPKQEFWAEDNREFLQRLGVSYVMFFGGAIDFVAGKFLRAPQWVQKIGLESPVRLIQDWRRWRREVYKLQFLWLFFTKRL